MSSKKESRREESEEKGARGNERGEGCARGRVCESILLQFLKRIRAFMCLFVWRVSVRGYR
jgi:hypothetical protein